MASGRMEFHAESIMQHTNFSFVLPRKFREELFGDPSKLVESDKNPEVLYKKRAGWESTVYLPCYRCG